MMKFITISSLFKIGIIFIFNVVASTSVNTFWEDNPNPYEYIVEHTPDRLKLLSEKFFKNGIPDELIDFYVPITATNELCQEQSLVLKSSLKKFYVWALKMWDSSGKFPSGILDGHFYDLGNFDECLAVSETGPYHVKYCLIQIKNLLAPAIYHSEMMTSKAKLFGSTSFVKDHLYLGRCIPASCGNEDLEKHYTSMISEYNMSVIINEHACTASNEHLPYNTWDWATLIFLILTTVLVIVSTVVDKFSCETTKKGTFLSLISCFSLYVNCNEILTTKLTNTKLSFLTGMKGFAMIFGILAHVLISRFSNPQINFLQLTKDYCKPTLFYAVSATLHLSVDIFFVISGFLLSYIEMRSIRSGRSFSLTLYYAKRFLRILPPCAAQIALFVTFIYRYVGSGPLWKVNMGVARDNCLKNWWTNLLFINNYVHQDEMCIPTNWYMAVFMQLTIVAPLILLPMLRWKAFRRYGIPLLIVIFNLWTSYISYSNDYKVGFVYEINNRTESTNQYIYITTQSRVSVFLMGLYLGYAISKSEETSEKKKMLSTVTVWIGWILTAFIHLLAVISVFYFKSYEERSILIDALYNGFHRTIYAGAVCWIIYACSSGYGGFLHKFLSSYLLQVMGRLSFETYLSQLLAINIIDSMTITSLQYKTIFNTIDGLARVPVAFIQSFCLSLLFQMPYIQLEKTLKRAFYKEDGPSTPKEQLSVVKEKDMKIE